MKISNLFKKYIVTGLAVCMVAMGAFALSVTGCQYYTDSQGNQTTKLTEDATKALDTASEMAPSVQGVVTAVGVAVPAIAGITSAIVAGIGAFFGAYKKYRPQITREQEKSTQAGNITKALVYAIETFKETDPASWDDFKGHIRAELADKVGPEAIAIMEALMYSYFKKE